MALLHLGNLSICQFDTEKNWKRRVTFDGEFRFSFSQEIFVLRTVESEWNWLRLLTNIQTLDLSNQVWHLPYCFSHVFSIDFLSCGQKGLDILAICNLQDAISHITLDSKQQNRIPSPRFVYFLVFSLSQPFSLSIGIGKLTKLGELKADGNLLVELPREILQCKSLRTLSLCSNRVCEDIWSLTVAFYHWKKSLLFVYLSNGLWKWLIIEIIVYCLPRFHLNITRVEIFVWRFLYFFMLLMILSSYISDNPIKHSMVPMGKWCLWWEW